MASLATSAVLLDSQSYRNRLNSPEKIQNGHAPSQGMA